MDYVKASKELNSPNKTEDMYSSTQQKSFESIMKAPYNINHNAFETTRSIESPYTSLGSCRSSYVSIKPNSYSSLRAKSMRASVQHETKTKAVLAALQNLQEKIGTLEVDRVKAETNLRSLTAETSEYKELLKQKFDNTSSSLGSHDTTKRDSQSEELEHQLENAQGRCLSLEKQLDSMRKLMKGQQQYQHQPQYQPQVPKDQRIACNTTASIRPGQNHQQQREQNSEGYRSPSESTKHSLLSSTVKDHKKRSRPAVQSPVPRLMATVQESPALEKLNGLEKEHVKLSLSQSHAEKKIRELEEKIREEKHCRKLLEDKAFELEQAVTQANLFEAKTTANSQAHKPKRKRKKKVVTKPSTSNSSSKTTTPRSPRQRQQQQTPSSPNHYLLDLGNIPFVVGQSTSRSHSVGANVQNVLSMMKAHSRLCEGTYGGGGGNTWRHSNPTAAPTDVFKSTGVNNKTTRSSSRRRKSDDLASLLDTVVKEFEQLVDDHRELSNRIEHEKNEHIRKNDQLELSHLFQKMESKGKQISMIRHHLKTSAHSSPPSSARSPQGGRLKIGPQEIEVVTTIRAPAKSKKASTPPLHAHETKRNAHLDLLKKVRNLQYSLQKDDLQWD